MKKKKILSLLMIFTLLFIVTGCFGKSEQEEKLEAFLEENDYPTSDVEGEDISFLERFKGSIRILHEQDPDVFMNHYLAVASKEDILNFYKEKVEEHGGEATEQELGEEFQEQYDDSYTFYILSAGEDVPAFNLDISTKYYDEYGVIIYHIYTWTGFHERFQ